MKNMPREYASPSMSREYASTSAASYREAINRVAARIKQARPAIEPEDERPIFNVVGCSVILAAAFDIKHLTVMTDLQEMVKP
jgi:hypothetical protein